MVIACVLAIVACGLFLRQPKRALWGCVYFFIVQDALVAAVGGRDTIVGAGLQNADEAILAGLLVTTVGVCAVARRLPRFRAWIGWYAIFVVAGSASVLSSTAGFSALLIGMFLVSKGFVFAFVVDQLEWTPEDAKRVVKGLFVCMLVVAAFAIPDLIAPEAFRRGIGFDPMVDYRSGLPSVVSLAGHPGGYGWLMAVGALLAIGLIFGSPDARWNRLFILFVVASAVSMRRKPLLGLIGAFILVAPTLARAMSARRLARIGLLVGTLAIPIAILLGPLVAEGARAYIGVEALTVQARTALYGGSLILARDHFPLGSGLGTYGSYGSVTSYSPIYYQFGFNLIYGMSPAYPNFIQDTFWPQILGETGILGVVGYGGALLSMLVAAWKAARTASGSTARAVAIGATLVGVETLLESSASPTYSIATCGCISLGLLTIAAALERSATSQAVPLNSTPEG